jgi:hypothetical protein
LIAPDMSKSCQITEKEQHKVPICLASQVLIH